LKKKRSHIFNVCDCFTWLKHGGGGPLNDVARSRLNMFQLRHSSNIDMFQVRKIGIQHRIYIPYSGLSLSSSAWKVASLRFFVHFSLSVFLWNIFLRYSLSNGLCEVHIFFCFSLFCLGPFFHTKIPQSNFGSNPGSYSL